MIRLFPSVVASGYKKAVSSLATSPRETGAGALSRGRVRAAVACILLLEIALFAWSFGKFFCGDSLFYLWYRLDTPAKLLNIFARPDHLHSYRPLTYVIASYLLFPLFHLNPLGYHAVALGAHLLITLLLYVFLRQWASPGAALAGSFVFGFHATAFYVTYDVSFLPDFSAALFTVIALVACVRWRKAARGQAGRQALAWLSMSLVSFLLALLSKESVVMLPVGLVAAEILCQEPGGPSRWTAGYARSLLRTLWPYLGICAVYLAWSFYIKGGRLFPEGPREPYALTLDLAGVKLRYFAWLLNFPLRVAPRGWPVYAASLAMLPALAWLGMAVLRAARRAWAEMALCAAWALSALLPALLIRQVPMKHNLYIALLAVAAGVAVAVDRSGFARERLLPRGWAFLALGMAACTALQVPGDLKASWVGAASDIAAASLDSVRTAYPRLPRGTTLFVLPSKVKGDISWYFQNGALFNLFYNDPSLQTRFADLGHQLPPDFATRPDVLIFDFAEGRLWDVTAAYQRDALDHESLRILEGEPQIESRLNWTPEALIEGRYTVAIEPVPRGGQCRRALVQMPGTTVRFRLQAIPPDSVLQLGLSRAGFLESFAQARLFFESGNATEVLDAVALDAVADRGHWLDWEIDLSRLAGRSGALVLEADPDPSADWIAWSRLRIISPSKPAYAASQAEVDTPLISRESRLLDRFDEAQTAFNLNELYGDYAHFDTPTGRPVFLFGHRGAVPARFTMVTVAGASARFHISRVPPGSVLELSATNTGQIGDGVRGRVIVESGARTVVFDELLAPRSRRWTDRSIPLDPWAGSPVTLLFQASSGPQGSTAGDWCAWAGLRIVPRKH
jgi:hypothetical protein